MTKNEIKYLVILEIVAPLPENEDEYTLPESIQDEIFKRFKDKLPWEEVFQPIKDYNLRNKYIDLFKELDNE